MWCVYERSPENSLPHRMKTQYEGDIYEAEIGPSPHLNLSILPISRSVRSKFLVFIRYPFMAFCYIEGQRDPNKFSVGLWEHVRKQRAGKRPGCLSSQLAAMSSKQTSSPRAGIFNLFKSRELPSETWGKLSSPCPGRGWAWLAASILQC